MVDSVNFYEWSPDIIELAKQYRAFAGSNFELLQNNIDTPQALMHNKANLDQMIRRMASCGGNKTMRTEDRRFLKRLFENPEQLVQLIRHLKSENNSHITVDDTYLKDMMDIYSDTTSDEYKLKDPKTTKDDALGFLVNNEREEKHEHAESDTPNKEIIAKNPYGLIQNILECAVDEYAKAEEKDELQRIEPVGGIMKSNRFTWLNPLIDAHNIQKQGFHRG